jgi:signal peptidase II
MKTHRTLGYVIAAIVFAIDQFAKYLVMVPFDLKNRLQIEINEIFQFTWVENRGVSLGMLHAEGELGRWLLIALTGAISIGVAIWLWRERNRQDVFGLGLILGGALGNIVDRIRLGHVVDFADLHFGEFRPFLVFNIADAAITVGVLILVFRALLVRDKVKVPENA